MKVLVTGFDPFGEDIINPAFEAVKLLPDEISGAAIIKQEIPTIFTKGAEVLKESINKYAPDVVICVGQAGGRTSVSIEKVAINLIEARIKDNAGNQPLGKAIIEDAPTAYFSNLPIKAMINSINANGLPAYISYTAGTFVCNELMYQLMHFIQKKKILGGFIHVPYIASQVIDKAATACFMSVNDIAKALEFGIRAVIDGDIENNELISGTTC